MHSMLRLITYICVSINKLVREMPACGRVCASDENDACVAIEILLQTSGLSLYYIGTEKIAGSTEAETMGERSVDGVRGSSWTYVCS